MIWRSGEKVDKNMENVNVGAAHPRNVRANVRINAPPNLDDLMQFANSNVIHLFGGAIQLKVSKFLDILLRLPPLFLMDQVSRPKKKFISK